MKKRWFVITLFSSLLFLLAGCGAPVEEQISSGITSAESIFKGQAEETNKNINEIELYLPNGYSIEKMEEKHNYIVQKGKKNRYILFVNHNEGENSRLHYDVLKNDQTRKIIEEKTFELEDAFGFVTVSEVDESTYELIVSSGAVKISSISDNKKIDEKLADMMTIARSVKVNK